MTTPNERHRLVKGRQPVAPFLRLPRNLVDSDAWIGTSPRAIKLLIDLLSQFRGYNNGDFSAAWKLMEPRGWRSRDQLHKAKNELLERDLIILTRQGGRNKCSLFGVTWLPIDECNGKLDVRSSSDPSHSWKRQTRHPPCGLTGGRLAHDPGHKNLLEGTLLTSMTHRTV
jgi:hypothetical protein